MEHDKSEDRPMAETESMVEPAHDDLLASEPAATPEDSEQPAAEPGAVEPDPGAAASRDSLRSLVRLGWALLAVLLVLAAVTLISVLQVSSQVNKLACVTRAQTAFLGGASGAGTTPADVQLSRLGLQVALKKCGT
jgi:hypothetical protein